MTNIEIDIRRRSATYKPRFNRPGIGIVKGQEVPCKVWGCFQCSDGDDINPYFVVELPDGRCTYVAPEDIQFTKEDEADA